MKYRLHTVHARKSYTSDTTEIIDLIGLDPISNLIIGLECTNSSATQTAHPMACLTKIEIVDGSKVLWSLDGYEAEAKDWYDNKGIFRSNYNTALNGGGESRYVGINFGRYLWDEALAFDPKKFVNPQLRVSLDIDAGANAPATIYITVWANLFDEKIISPQGFLMAKEIKEYTISSAVHEYTDLPTDYMYRNIYFRPFVAGTEPNQCVSNFKLSEDNDKRIPYDHGVQDIERMILNMYPPVKEHYYFADDTTAKYLYVAPSTRVAGLIQAWKATAPAGTHSFYDGDGGRAAIIAGTAGENINVFVHGYVPHCVYQIPCGMQDDISDWWNVQSIDRLRADITGAATSTGYLCVEQLFTY